MREYLNEAMVALDLEDEARERTYQDKMREKRRSKWLAHAASVVPDVPMGPELPVHLRMANPFQLDD